MQLEGLVVDLTAYSRGAATQQQNQINTASWAQPWLEAYLAVCILGKYLSTTSAVSQPS